MRRSGDEDRVSRPEHCEEFLLLAHPAPDRNGLRDESAEFTRIWNTNPVHAPGHRTKALEHPEVGRVRVNCDVLPIPEDDQQIVFITADPGTTAARSLRHLLESRQP